MNQLCGQAMGYTVYVNEHNLCYLSKVDVLMFSDHSKTQSKYSISYDPQSDDQQAMDLIKTMKLRIDISKDGRWLVSNGSPSSLSVFTESRVLNIAIVECVAKIQLEKMLNE